MAKVLLILMLFCGLVHQSTALTNLNSMKGDSLTLKCDLPITDTSVVLWKDTVYNSNREPHVIYDSSNSDEAFKDGFSISNNDLVIKNTAESGNFWCEVITNGNTTKKEYKLYVVEAYPVCSGKLDYYEGEKVNVSCMAYDALTIYPELNGNQNDDLETMTWDSKFVAKPEHDGKIFECRAFNDSKFSCSWKFNVKYEVRNLEGPPRPSYLVGDTINCSAIGNPTPEMTMLVDGKEVVSQSSKQIDFKLGENLVKGGGVMVKCLAKNELLKVKTLEKSFNITVSHRPSAVSDLLGENGYILLIVIIVVIALVLLLILITVLVCRRKRNGNRQKQNQTTLLKHEARKDYADEVEA